MTSDDKGDVENPEDDNTDANKKPGSGTVVKPTPDPVSGGSSTDQGGGSGTPGGDEGDD